MDFKAWWRAINEIINKKSKSTNINCIKNSGQEISNNREIANAMNDCFSSIDTDIASKIEETVNPLLSGKLQVKARLKNLDSNLLQGRTQGKPLPKLPIQRALEPTVLQVAS